MPLADLICASLAFLGLAAIVGWCLRSAYCRGNPKPRPPLTRWEDGK